MVMAVLRVGKPTWKWTPFLVMSLPCIVGMFVLAWRHP